MHAKRGKLGVWVIRDKNIASGRRKTEAKKKTQILYTVAVHTVKTAGREEAPASTMSDLISLLATSSCILYKTGAMGGGVAWGTVCIN